jgi:hypothetical protein
LQPNVNRVLNKELYAVSRDCYPCAGCSNNAAAGNAAAPADDDDEDEDDDGFCQIGALTIKTSFGSGAGGLLSAVSLHAAHDTQPPTSAATTCRQQQPRQHHNDASHHSPPPMSTDVSHSPPLLPASVTCAEGQLAAAVSRSASCNDQQLDECCHRGGFTSPSLSTPADLESFLGELGLSKYVAVFEEQDVDFPMFLTLTDNDLKEIGVKLFGPRRKMTTAIARYNSVTHPTTANQQHETFQTVPLQNCQTGDELERVRSQLQQERQLRAVTEVCLMEDRISWQQVTAVAADTLQTCNTVHNGLLDISQCCEELWRRLATDSNIDDWTGSMPGMKDQGLPSVESNRRDLSQLSLFQIIGKMRNLGTELGVSVSSIGVSMDKLMKRTSSWT